MLEEYKLEFRTHRGKKKKEKKEKREKKKEKKKKSPGKQPRLLVRSPEGIHPMMKA